MENLKLAARTVLGKYTGFHGRASRSEFWWWALTLFLAMLVLNIIDAVVIAPLLGLEGAQPLSAIVSLGVLLPNIAVAIRRLHDIGRSGWWLLLCLIPVIGFLVLLYFYVQPSEPGENRFGAPEPWPGS